MTRHHVFVVDDNPSDLLMASFLIEKMGFVPIQVASGFAALEEMPKYVLSAAIIDIQMKDMNGFSVLRQLRADPKFKDLPVMMMSARNDVSDIRKAITLGANDYIIKPVDAMIFTSKLQHLVGKESNWVACDIDPEIVSAKSFLRLETRLLSLSEMGLKIASHGAVRPGCVIPLEIDLFNDIGVGDVTLKVISCEPLSDSEFVVEFSFVGMKETDLQKIRMMCRQLWNMQKKTA